jgi:hypothetical protein
MTMSREAFDEWWERRGRVYEDFPDTAAWDAWQARDAEVEAMRVDVQKFKQRYQEVCDDAFIQGNGHRKRLKELEDENALLKAELRPCSAGPYLAACGPGYQPTGNDRESVAPPPKAP